MKNQSWQKHAFHERKSLFSIKPREIPSPFAVPVPLTFSIPQKTRSQRFHGLCGHPPTRGKAPRHCCSAEKDFNPDFACFGIALSPFRSYPQVSFQSLRPRGCSAIPTSLRVFSTPRGQTLSPLLALLGGE